MVQSYFNGLADMMPLAKRAGLPLETALRILCGGPAGIPVVSDRIPKILGQDAEVDFTLNAVFKDNDVFQRVLGFFGLNSQTLTEFGERNTAVAEKGLLEHDPAAMITMAYEND